MIQPSLTIREIFITRHQTALAFMEKAYTGKTNVQVWENLHWLTAHTDPAHVTIRAPLIPEFNTAEDIDHSIMKINKLGFALIDRLTYRIMNG